MTNTILHKADTRGDANHGWLHSRQTFSFANYHNSERMHFNENYESEASIFLFLNRFTDYPEITANPVR